MFEFDPFDLDFDGDVDGIDFLGFECLMRYVPEVRQDDDDDTTEGKDIPDNEISW